jgi:SAM-dependent methyltransferase
MLSLYTVKQLKGQEVGAKSGGTGECGGIKPAETEHRVSPWSRHPMRAAAISVIMRINIGCGQAPTKGWQNYDNSLSLRLAKLPVLPEILWKLGFLESLQYQFIRFARENPIKYGDATKGLPIQDASVGVIYSSHMLEHLDRSEAAKFLKEALRILRPGGIIRIAVPDIKKQTAQYIESGDADAFIEATYFCVARPRSFVQRLRLLLAGTRGHRWMYDGKSLSLLLKTNGFVNADVLSAGRTKIPAHGQLDLNERESESVYVEAEKPNA